MTPVPGPAMLGGMTTLLPTATYLEHLRAESARFRDVLACTDGPTLTLDLGRFTGHDPRKDADVDEEDIRLAEADGAPAATVSGRAEDLLLWMWGRADESPLTVDGDPGAADVARRVFAQPIT